MVTTGLLRTIIRGFCAAKNGATNRFRAAIVGSGPAAFYCAESLEKFYPELSVDVFERLPVPYGLIRFGVAPDHPELKNCITGFERFIQRLGVGQRFQFYGNIRVGEDVKLADLQLAYNLVVLAYGAESERTLGVDGDNARNCISARRFVGWYNGDPELSDDFSVDLEKHDTAVIFGQGNVAVDVCRTLLTPVDILAKTDITERALTKLKSSRIRRCVLVGRRGPLQAAFTTAELRELIKAPHCAPIIHQADFDDVQSKIDTLDRPRKRLTSLMLDTAKKPPRKLPDCEYAWELRFLRSPSKILRDEEGAVNGVELAVNRLVSESGKENDYASTKALDTGGREKLDCGLVLYSIGYKSVNIETNFLPFDSRRNVVKADAGGRVENAPGLYACGWCGRGATGVLAATQIHAKLIAETIREDVEKGRLSSEEKPGFSLLENDMKKRGISYVNWDDWQKMDEEETRRGRAVGKPREKIVDRRELLKIASRK